MALQEPELLLPIRRRGPKPVSLRAHFAATSWLDGEILWRDGHVVWRHQNKLIAPDSRQLEIVSKALLALKRHEEAARRHQPDFEAWYRERLKKWRLAQRLISIHAPDLETLVSQSRRRNPAAVERLAPLLIVEALVSEPLPNSPSHALLEAWPLSQSALQSLLRDEEVPLAARAHAALVLGAASPALAYPKHPYLRRLARYGARKGFPTSPRLVTTLLQSESWDIESDIRRIEATLEKRTGETRSPLAFEADELRALALSGLSAAAIAPLAETAAAFPDPFPLLDFVPVFSKRRDIQGQRDFSNLWKEMRRDFHASIRASLLRVAKNGRANDLAIAFELLEHFISYPLLVLGQVKLENIGDKAQRKKSLNSFEKHTREAVTAVTDIFTWVAASNESSPLLELMSEATKAETKWPEGVELTPKAWSGVWHNWLLAEREKQALPIIRVAKKIGVEKTHRARQTTYLKEFDYADRLSGKVLEFALEIIEWSPTSAPHTLRWLNRLGSKWQDVETARRQIKPVLNSLHDNDGDSRAAWLKDIYSARYPRSKIGFGMWPFVALFIPTIQKAAINGGEHFPRETLLEIVMALWQSEPTDGIDHEARASWLVQEALRLFEKNERKAVDWYYLAQLTWMMYEIAGKDDDRFRDLMSSCWRFADQGGDFNLYDMTRGVKILRRFPAFVAVLAANFSARPNQCFRILEKLEPLQKFPQLLAPLDAWRDRKLQKPDPLEWRGVLELDESLSALVARYVTAREEVGESQERPASVSKILAWPQKIASEIAALRERGDLNSKMVQRVENLTARLADSKELHASMAREIRETLENITVGTELRAAELTVENIFRIRLQSMGAIGDVPIDGNLINAALFSTDIETNRKWLREMVRAHCAQKTDWRSEIEGNARWLQKLESLGVKWHNWSAPAPRQFSVGGQKIELRLESDPLQILQMGNYFDTCLSRGGCNSFSSVANAVELNKRVVFARDEKGRVVGRQLLGLSQEGQLVGFHAYASVPDKNVATLRAAFGNYAWDFAVRCGLGISNEGTVERLFVADWWDDGTIDWADLDLKRPKRKKVKKKQNASAKATV